MSELDAFLQSAKAQGASDEFLVSLLKDQGWPQSEIYTALGRHYAAATGLPIPQAPGRLESAREAFFHLLAFATLATWVFATGSLWFEFINKWFPDPAMAGDYSDWRWSRVSWQMACLIVGFPAFLYSTRTILAEMERNPDKAVSPIRRWLTNIALLITALVFIGDVVAFVAAFLQGELTARFLLKCLTVFVLAGAVFLYYNRPATRLWNRSFAIAAAAAILLSLGLGILKSGSPSERRAYAEDRRRVQDLYQIAMRLQRHWGDLPVVADPRLPARLEDLSIGTTGSVPLKDPFLGTPYTYHYESGSSYRLCAVFSTATQPDSSNRLPAWNHTSGRVCFDLDAAKNVDPPGSWN